MKALFIMNSDFGVRGTIGWRTVHTAAALGKGSVVVICRNKKKGLPYDARSLGLAGTTVMKALTAIPIYAYKRFPSNEYKTRLFTRFVLKQLRNIDLEEFDIVHAWDYLPEVFKVIKERNPKIRILKDMTMSINTILKPLKKKEKYWLDMPLDIPKDFLAAKPYVDYYVAPSESTRESLVLAGVPRGRILLTPLGSDIEGFTPKKRKKGDKGFRVCFLGNINHRKGVAYLLEAWKALDLPGAELHLYGHVYQEIMPFLKEKERFRIFTHGQVHAPTELPKNDVMVHPSLLESSPKVINEALASGLPVITTYNSGPTFIDGKQGFIIPAQSAKAIERRLSYFYHDRKALDRFSKEARRFAERMTWKRYSRLIRSHYRKVTAA